MYIEMFFDSIFYSLVSNKVNSVCEVAVLCVESKNLKKNDVKFTRYNRSFQQSCDNALTSSASSQCLNQLSAFIGPNILRGRVEQYNPR